MAEEELELEVGGRLRDFLLSLEDLSEKGGALGRRRCLKFPNSSPLVELRGCCSGSLTALTAEAELLLPLATSFEAIVIADGYSSPATASKEKMGVIWKLRSMNQIQSLSKKLSEISRALLFVGES